MGVRIPAVVGVCLLLAGPAGAYEVNARHWPAMPIPYYVNPAGAPDFGDGSTAEQVVADAVATWSAAPCATVSFQAMGTTDATWAADGRNVVFFVTDTWGFGKAAAGATLWLPTAEGEPMEVDLALNAVDFKWIAGGGDATKADVVDPRSVITHELGHWLGLAHSADVFATMYQALLPSGMQATLGGDDLAGICALYPNGSPGCGTDLDCAPERTCAEIEDQKVCDKRHDPLGAPCDKDHLNCAGMCFISLYECSTVCAFTAYDYSTGYCAPLCGADGNCPEGSTCNPIPGRTEARVCLLEPPAKDATPEAADEALESSPEGTGGDEADSASPDPGPVIDAAVGDEGSAPADPPPDERPGGSGSCRAVPGGRAGGTLILLLPCLLLGLRRQRRRRVAGIPPNRRRHPPGPGSGATLRT